MMFPPSEKVISTDYNIDYFMMKKILTKIVELYTDERCKELLDNFTTVENLLNYMKTHNTKFRFGLLNIIEITDNTIEFDILAEYNNSNSLPIYTYKYEVQ